MVKKILVIENRAETRKLFVESLEANGFYTISAEDGLIGVQKSHKDVPDLIISEIQIPKLDGYKVLTEVRKNSKTAIIPLIFVTTKMSRNDIRKGIEMGADDYLTKPCKVEELLSAIAACFKKRALLQQFYSEQSQPVLPTPNGTTKLINLDSIFPYDPDLMEVFLFIEANYHLPITLRHVADAVGYSSAYLTNWVRRQTGKTVQSWIIQRRMAAARFLLLETNEAIEEIALKIGYQSLVHFFRQFRTHHGTTPQVWRKLKQCDEI
ncbi:MAG: DNA-binding response regulator [Stigonema ocellatum SAG 48.90 = DSM 106950]|nr:DNA-binding response regulator [Stigonema ocellatum SAG 48.90 = DSM 106950]